MAVETEPLLLRALLYPQSIAVIGASSAARKAGGRRWLSIIGEGFPGQIYPISTTNSELNGFPTRPSIFDVPGPVDLAIVLVPTAAVFNTLRQCSEKKVRAAVVVSAGFGETGSEGKRLESEMTRMLRSAGARMLGPNSAGVFSAGGAVNSLGWKVPRGRMAVITQSGNMAVTFTEYAKAKSVGFASIIAMGNSADLALSELVELHLGDEQTTSILIYCEGFAPGDGRRLVNIVRATARKVPIVILKPGVSEAGRVAAKSHTGALAGEDSVVSAALFEAGIIRASETEEAFDLALALGACPPMKGRRLAVLSDGGGHATVVSDCAGRCGLELAMLSETTRSALKEILPARAAVENPIDFAGFAESDPDSTAKAVDVCIKDDGVDGAIFAGHFGGYHLMTTHAETQQRISALEKAAASEMVTSANRVGKPLIVHTDHGERDLATLTPLRTASVPIYSSLESAAKSMAALSTWHGILARARATEPAPTGIPDVPPRHDLPSAAAHSRVLSEDEARARLLAAGIRVPKYTVVTSEDEAIRELTSFDCAIVMKLVSPHLVHKSDLGGVVLNVETEPDVRSAYRHLAELSTRLEDASPRVLVTAMIQGGVECIVGAKCDPQFGPIVLFGAGGVLVELVADASICLAPTTPQDAKTLIASSAVGRLLKGFRGSKPADVDSLIDIIVRVSKLIVSSIEVNEVDLNPVIVTDGGAFIADARLVLT